MTSTHEPDWRAGLEIETTAKLIDSAGLGTCVAELSSDQQADFLAGLTEGLSAFEGPLDRDMQCHYIADQFKDSPGVGLGVCDLLRALADSIEHAVAAR